MRIFLMVAAGVLAAPALTASAQELNTGHLAAIDTNGDGGVSMEEFSAAMGAAFVRLDANSDGSLTLEEAGGIISPEQFAAADADSNGGLSRAEYDAQVAADFATADKDASGALN